MPSLRRTISSPSVRSMPYPSLSNAVNAAQTNRGNAHRRSSGSEIGSRRVLADIEWWKVIDGQRVLDVDQESDREQNQDSPTGQSPLTAELLGGGGLNADGGVERPSTPSLEEVCHFFITRSPRLLFESDSVAFTLVLAYSSCK